MKLVESVVPVLKPCLALTFIALCLSSRAASHDQWTGSWYVPPVQFSPQISDVTLRTFVTISIGGDKLRLRLSNQYGKSSLTVGVAYVGVRNAIKQVTFKGSSGVVVPAGAAIDSDQIDVQTLAGDEIAISVYYPDPVPRELTVMDGASARTVITPGNTAAQTQLSEATSSPFLFDYFLVGVDVQDSDARGTIVALGDSITAGGPERWPGLLATRLAAVGKHYGVLNAGIGGNRLASALENGSGLFGDSALNRLDRDVLSQPGIRYVIVYEGINDLGLGETSASDGSEPPSVEKIEHAIVNLALRSHLHNVKIYVATLAPFEGATLSSTYYTHEKNEVRKTLNNWIRQSSVIDGFFDFDRALADPSKPNRLNPAFDSGDHLHPNEKGERALSEFVNLSCFD